MFETPLMCVLEVLQVEPHSQRRLNQVRPTVRACVVLLYGCIASDVVFIALCCSTSNTSHTYPLNPRAAFAGLSAIF